MTDSMTNKQLFPFSIEGFEQINEGFTKLLTNFNDSLKDFRKNYDV